MAQVGNISIQIQGHKLAQALVLACGLFTFISLIVVIAQAYGPLPGWDQWEEAIMYDYRKQFFTQHNEHRPLLARLFFMADTGLFGGLNIFNLVSIFLLQLLHAGLLLILGRRAGIEKRDLVILSGFVFTLMFSVTQVENFTWGFQVQFVGVFTLATASFFLLAQFGNHLSGFILSLILGVMAVGMMANGLMVLWLLILLSFSLYLSRGKIFLLIAVATAISIFYFWGYAPAPGSADPLATIQNPLRLFGYILCYLGGPLTTIFRLNATWRFVLGAGIGLAGLLFMLRLAASFYASRFQASAATPKSAQLALLYVAVFVTLSALVTGLGRGTPWESRYATPALIFFAANFILFWSLKDRFAWARSFYVRLFVLSLSFIFVCGQIIHMIIAPSVGIQRREEIALFLSYADAPYWMKRSHPEVSFTKFQRDNLRSQNLSIFRDTWAGWRQKRLADVVNISAQPCDGSIGRVLQVGKQDYLIEGRVRFVRQGLKPRRLVFADARNRVTGYAFGYKQPGKGIADQTRKEFIFFRGFAHQKAEILHIYALSNDNTVACRLQHTADLLGAPFLQGALVMSDPVLGGSFRLNSIPQMPVPPFEGAAFDTYIGDWNADNTLRWRSQLLPRNIFGLAVPLWAGRGGKTLSVDIVAASTGEVLLHLNPAPTATWNFVVVAVPAKLWGERLEIIAKDSGRGLGSWLAVGQPQILLAKSR